jgi:hypothetical protein
LRRRRRSRTQNRERTLPARPATGRFQRRPTHLTRRQRHHVEALGDRGHRQDRDLRGGGEQDGPTPIIAPCKLPPDQAEAAAERPLSPQEAEVPRRQRLNLALLLLSAAIIINLILLFSGDTSPGWLLASVILLGAAGAAMLSQRREP